jgi:hypothetical protein
VAAAGLAPVTRHSAPPDATGAVDGATIAGPPRPPLVELASAVLIVGGIVNLIGALAATFASAGTVDPFLWLTLALNVAWLVLGILTRYGRAWLVTLNFAAILGFLDILGSAANPSALMLGIAEVLVVVILIRHKPWFDAMRETRALLAAEPARR